MDSTFLTCPICYEEFNLTTYLPKILPSCGHTICSECLKKLLKNQTGSQRRCPKDKQAFPAGLANVDAFKTNFLVNEIFDTRSQKELCPDHDEEMNVICFTDQKKICSTCVFEGTHQNHKVKTIKALKLEANSQAKKIQGTLKDLDICHSKARQTMNEKKTVLLDGVKREFQAIKKRVADKEQDIIYQIHSYFYNQEQKLENLIGNSSSTWKNLDSDAYELDKILKNEEFFKNGELFQQIQDHLANCNTTTDYQALEEENEIIKSKIEGVLKSFNEFLTSQTQTWSEFQFGLKKNLFRNLAKGVLKDVPAASNDNPDQMETEEDPFILKLSTAFDFEETQDTLIISTTDLPSEKILNIEKWKKAKNASLYLQHEIVGEDLEVLNFIWRNLKGNGLLDLYLDLSSILISEDALEILAQREISYSKVSIFGEEFNFTSEQEAKLLGRILSQCKNLEEVSLTLDGAKLGKLTLQNILGDVLSNGENIQTLRLYLSGVTLDDDNICELPLKLLRIKNFTLNLPYTNVTNRVIEWLGKDCFKLISGLEAFELSLQGTKITDAFMHNLFSAFKKIKSLTLDLAETKITDITLKALSRTMPSFANDLEKFCLGLTKNNVTEEGICSTFMCLPNIQTLSLFLPETKITDKAIELLSQKTLSYATKLKVLTLFLSNTTVTDKSMQKVFGTLGELDGLDLRLDSTRITDNSIAPFIIDRVQPMKGLKIFSLDVQDTEVSQSVQEKIQELQKTINRVESSVC